MYTMIVRATVRGVFAKINQGDYHAMVDGLADEFTYVFHGEHALGGRRTSKDTMNRWWERTLRLLPGAQFSLLDILVNGPPWRTRVATRARVSGDLPDGTRYENTVFQFLTLRWGRVTEVETVEDLQVLQRALAVVASSGVDEALAEPLQD